jgi:hypothetical protein
MAAKRNYKTVQKTFLSLTGSRLDRAQALGLRQADRQAVRWQAEGKQEVMRKDKKPRLPDR